MLSRIWPKRNSERLEKLVRAVSTFINEQVNGDSGAELLPQIIAKAVGESYLAVLGALYVLEERGAVKHWYGVYCTVGDIFLAKTDSLEDAKTLVYCRKCEKHHDARNETAYIELFFTVTDLPQIAVAMSEAA